MGTSIITEAVAKIYTRVTVIVPANIAFGIVFLGLLISAAATVPASKPINAHIVNKAVEAIAPKIDLPWGLNSGILLTDPETKPKNIMTDQGS